MEFETNNKIWFEEQQTRKKISKIFYRYEKTFPENERRDKHQFLDLTENPNAYILSINNEDEIIGYAIIWELTAFYFLEHFEIYEEFRNQKFGTEVLESLYEKYEKIVLETEPENLSELARRRLSFYERNSFTIVEKKYLQPSYGEGKPAINLFLMANFLPENIENTIKEIHKTVYEK